MHMFPDTDNNLGLISGKKYLDLCNKNIPLTNCLLEALELCLICNNSIFKNENYLQIDSTAQGPHMPCSYAEIAVADFGQKALEYHFSPTSLKTFREDAFVLWPHSTDTLSLFLEQIMEI